MCGGSLSRNAGFALFEEVPCGGLVVWVRFVSGRVRPPIGSSHFGTESDLEFELVERPACFDCSQLWAHNARRKLELETQISSDMITVPRML